MFLGFPQQGDGLLPGNKMMKSNIQYNFKKWTLLKKSCSDEVGFFIICESLYFFILGIFCILPDGGVDGSKLAF